MKRDMITLKTPEGLTLKVPSHVVASTFISAVLAQLGGAQALPAPAANVLATPAIGEYWPGQGGHNAGLVPERAGVPAHYLIVAAKDVGSHEWGGRGKESCGTSKTDGLLNTQILLSDGGHPVAQACADYQADGHNDFYLPAAAELYHCWVHAQALFATDCYYWASTQRSANNAFSMLFEGGTQTSYAKYNELRVRPVRRLFI